MADPWTGAGIAAGGLFQMIGGILGSSSGPPTMDPAVQAALASGQLDLAEYTAEMTAAQWGIDTGWKQKWSKYGAEMQSALEKDYAANFGMADRFAKDFVSRVAAGQPTEATVNLLSGQMAMQGRAKAQVMDQVNQQIAASGLDPNSPAAQELKNKAMSNLLASETAQTTSLLSERQTADQATATNLLSWMSDPNRLRGVGWVQDEQGNWIQEGPEVPQTEEEEFEAQKQEWMTGMQGQIDTLTEQMKNATSPMARRGLQIKISSLKNQMARRSGETYQYPGEGGVETTTNRPITTWENAQPGGGYEEGTTKEGGTNYLSRGSGGSGKWTEEFEYAPGKKGYYGSGGNTHTGGYIRGADREQIGTQAATNWLSGLNTNWSGAGWQGPDMYSELGIDKTTAKRMANAMEQEKRLNPQFKPTEEWYRKQGVKRA